MGEANRASYRIMNMLALPRRYDYRTVMSHTIGDIIEKEYEPVCAQLRIAKEALNEIRLHGYTYTRLGLISITQEAVDSMADSGSRGISEKSKTSEKSEPVRILDL